MHLLSRTALRALVTGIDYEQVSEMKGYELERYACPDLPLNDSIEELSKACDLVAPDLSMYSWRQVAELGQATTNTKASKHCFDKP